MKVVISTLNSKFIHSSLAPWCLLAGIKEYCKTDVTAVVTEGTINENLENIANRIIAEQPDLIGFSCYIWNIEKVKILIQALKSRLPNLTVVLGGPEVSYNAENVFNDNEYVDYIISGEGEIPFAKLIDLINLNGDISNIDGVCYKSAGKVIIKTPFVSDTDMPSPYTEEYFEALNGRIAYLETSRGCPYSCAFCLSGRCGKARFYNIERAKKEIIILANSGTQTVKLVDRTFNANKKRAYDLIEFIISEHKRQIPDNVCFHFEIAGDILDQKTIKLLNTVPDGLIQLEIGLQSFNEKTLEKINRKTDTEKLKQNIKALTRLNNIHIHIDLIAGLPLEDFESFKKSFNIAYSLCPNMLQLGFLKILYGSPMYENRHDFPCEYSKEPPYEVVSTPWIRQEELNLLHYVEDALERMYNSGRFTMTLEYLFKVLNITAFDLFFNFGKYLSEKSLIKITLDDYTRLVFNYFSSLPEIDKSSLRDIMVCDRLSTNSSGTIPEILKIKDKKLKKINMYLNKNALQPKNVKRGLAILYSKGKVVYTDYIDSNKHTVTCKYPLNYIGLEEIFD